MVGGNENKLQYDITFCYSVVLFVNLLISLLVLAAI